MIFSTNTESLRVIHIAKNCKFYEIELDEHKKDVKLRNSAYSSVWKKLDEVTTNYLLILGTLGLVWQVMGNLIKCTTYYVDNL